jgi:hypothetical protein
VTIEQSGSEYELNAFQQGFGFWEHPKHEYMPPIDDAGRWEWLKGFCQAHAAYPDSEDLESGETAQEALDRLLEGHPALPALKAMLEAIKTQLAV